jgi:AraC-like DNA-binding protein
MDEITKSLQNKNLSESERTVKEIAKEVGLKRMI